MNNLLSGLPITAYCERAESHAFFAEPINTLSNAAFFISAYCIYRLLKQHQTISWKLRILPYLVALVGIRSTAWHTFHTPFTLLLDAVPIYLFFFFYFFLFSTWFLKSSFKAFLVTLLIAMLLLSVTLVTPPAFLNGSIRHVINLGLLLGMSVIVSLKSSSNARDFFVVFVVYAAAILLRSFDQVVCSWLPIRTHFTWHLLTAIAVVLVSRALINLYRDEGSEAKK